MDIAETIQLAASLRGETESLLKKQRRKGADYRFREGIGRPVLQGEEGAASDGSTPGADDPFASTDSVRQGGGVAGANTSLSHQQQQQQQQAPSAGAKSGTTSSGTGQASTGLSLEAYDPREVAAREERLLQDTVAKLRLEASRVHHAAETKQKEYDALQSELVKLKHEDDVALEREDAMREMAAEKERIASIQAEYDATTLYEKTLGHMLGRAQRDKLAQLEALRSFEDAIKVHKHELELAEGMRRTVHKSRDTEVAELAKMRGDVKEQLRLLDVKLEARRMEVKARQEKAKWRMAKLQVGGAAICARMACMSSGYM